MMPNESANRQLPEHTSPANSLRGLRVTSLMSLPFNPRCDSPPKVLLFSLLFRYILPLIYVLNRHSTRHEMRRLSINFSRSERRSIALDNLDSCLLLAAWFSSWSSPFWLLIYEQAAGLRPCSEQLAKIEDGAEEGFLLDPF